MAYTGNDYQNFNAYLRGQTAGWPPWKLDEYKKMTEDADNALKDAASHGVDHNGTVYRGIDLGLSRASRTGIDPSRCSMDRPSVSCDLSF